MRQLVLSWFVMLTTAAGVALAADPTVSNG